MQITFCRDSPIMHSSVPDEFKPAIFAQGACRRVLSVDTVLRKMSV